MLTIDRNLLFGIHLTSLANLVVKKGYSNLMDHYRTFCIPTGFSQYELMSDPIISRISNLSTLINAKLDKSAKSSNSFDTAKA